VEVKYKDWAFVGGHAYSDEDPIFKTGVLGGHDFVMNTQSLKFTFVDSVYFMTGRSAGVSTAVMAIGTCTRA